MLLPSRESLGHFIRFFGTSCTALAVDYSSTAIGVYCGVSPYVSLLFGLFSGGIVGFLLLTYWVFPTNVGRFSARRIGGFVAGTGLIYVVRALCVWLWGLLGLGDAFIYIGLLFAYGVSFFSNFCFQKYAVFAPRTPPPAV